MKASPLQTCSRCCVQLSSLHIQIKGNFKHTRLSHIYKYEHTCSTAEGGEQAACQSTFPTFLSTLISQHGNQICSALDHFRYIYCHSSMCNVH